MNIVVIGVGYVGLVTGLGLAKLNHTIQFLDIDIDTSEGTELGFD